jgi:hypothetical protein
LEDGKARGKHFAWIIVLPPPGAELVNCLYYVEGRMSSSRRLGFEGDDRLEAEIQAE